MARKQAPKPRSYFEPWQALVSSSFGDVPNVEGLPEDAAASILDGHERSRKNAPWIVWGSGMFEPSAPLDYLSGQRFDMDDRRIIAVRKPTTGKEDAPNAEEIAKRIASCVSAMAGIADPIAFIEDARKLFKDYSQGVNVTEPATEDTRFLRLWCQCVPLSEQRKGGYGEQPSAD